MTEYGKKREGFSLIELVIAIAILAIFSGTVALSIGILRSTDTKGLANGINDSMTDLKAFTESRTGPFYLHIYKTDNGFYSRFDALPKMDTIPDDTSGDERLGASTLRVDAVWTNDDGTVSERKTIGNDDYVQSVQMRKKDGAFEPNISVNEGGSLTPTLYPLPNRFEVKDADTDDAEVEYVVYLSRDTGQHFLEQVN